MVEPGEYDVRCAEYYRGSAPGPSVRIRAGDPPIRVKRPKLTRRGVAGTVVEGGRPVRGAWVRIYCRPEEGYLTPGDAYRLNAVTGEDGAFRFFGMDHGIERVILVARGETFSFARSAEIIIPAEGVAEGAVVEPVPGADLEIRVKNSDGAPARHATVCLRDDGVPPLEIEEYAKWDGVLLLPRLPPGDYQVEAEMRHVTARTSLSWPIGGGGPLEITLPR